MHTTITLYFAYRAMGYRPATAWRLAMWEIPLKQGVTRG